MQIVLEKEVQYLKRTSYVSRNRIIIIQTLSMYTIHCLRPETSWRGSFVLCIYF